MSHTPSKADNGYTTGFYDGKQAEQERILKLLATQWLPIANVDACIALIKGKK